MSECVTFLLGYTSLNAVTDIFMVAFSICIGIWLGAWARDHYRGGPK